MTEVMTEAELKEIAVQLANVLIANAADEKLTGEEKEHRVIEFMVKLDDNLPFIGALSNELEASIVEVGVDKVQAYIHEMNIAGNIKSFVKKCYNRIRHIFKKK